MLPESTIFGRRRADHENWRDETRAERLVHGRGVPRPDRDAFGLVAPERDSVHFTPGARTAWHTHPHGQTIYVIEGVGLAQRRGGPIEVIRPGDRVFFEPDEEHWHGASAARFMAHVAMLQADDAGNNASWGDHVTDEEYAAAPAIEV